MAFCQFLNQNKAQKFILNNQQIEKTWIEVHFQFLFLFCSQLPSIWSSSCWGSWSQLKHAINLYFKLYLLYLHVPWFCVALSSLFQNCLSRLFRQAHSDSPLILVCYKLFKKLQLFCLSKWKIDEIDKQDLKVHLQMTVWQESRIRVKFRNCEINSSRKTDQYAGY